MMVDFLKYRYIFYALSIGFLVVGGIAYFTKGFQYSVDFVGGSEVRVSFKQPMETADLRKTLSQAGYQDAVIQSIGRTGGSFIIQVKESQENIGEKIFICDEVSLYLRKNIVCHPLRCYIAPTNYE